MKHHSFLIRILTPIPLAGRGTVLAGQFDWGGFLPKSNGGALWYSQHGWQPCVERMSRRMPDCETYKSSRRESGLK
jgi:hypothetical protein